MIVSISPKERNIVHDKKKRMGIKPRRMYLLLKNIMWSTSTENSGRGYEVNEIESNTKYYYGYQ